MSLEFIVLQCPPSKSSAAEGTAAIERDDALVNRYLHRQPLALEGGGSPPMICFLLFCLRYPPRNPLRLLAGLKFFWRQRGQNEDGHIYPRSHHPLVRPSASITARNILIVRGNV